MRAVGEVRRDKKWRLLQFLRSLGVSFLASHISKPANLNIFVSVGFGKSSLLPFIRYEAIGGMEGAN